MRKESSSARAAFALLLLAASIGKAMPDGGVGAVPLPIQSALPAEAPSSLFSAKLGPGPDDDAELLISGTWSATIISSLDLQSQPGSSLSATFQPLLFTQTPDVSLSFLLYKKFFVEAHVSDDITQAYYAVGYKGGEGELLRDARIGNDGINFPSLPFLSFGDGSYRSFGAAATIATDNFTGKAMVRYDEAQQVTKHFAGSTEVIETTITPNSFIVGKYFMTRTAPATNLVVYVQSASGSLTASDGYLYRQLGSDEYSYSALTGVVTLASAALTRVLAHSDYTGSTDGITIGGQNCDLLYVPPPVPATGTLDPKLQVLDRYPTTATPTSAEAFVRNPSSGLRDPNYQARIDPSGFIEVTRIDAEAPSPAVQAKYSQPFAAFGIAAIDANMAWLYTTDFASGIKTGSAPVYTRNIIVQGYSTAALISIDKNFVPGSIQVTRNGIPEYSFSVNANTGVLTMSPPPSPTDDIVITYMQESSDRSTGIIVGALGGFWDLGDGENAWTALGASWSVPGTSFSSGSQTNPGSINLTAGEEKDKGIFTHNAAMATRYSQDDATGTYQVESMESTTGYASDFMPASAAPGYPSAVEAADTTIVSAFASLINSLHADGSTQEALEITAGTAVPGIGAQGTFFKVESAPPYPSFKSISFFAKFPSTGSLTLQLDDGASPPNPSVQIILPPGSGTGAWRRYLLHYGKGDSTVYAQDSESSPEVAVAGATAPYLPSITSTGARLAVGFNAAAASDQAWITQVLLEDSVGSVALLFQGQAVYADPGLRLAIGDTPIVSDIKLSGDSQAAADSTPYVSGGGEIDSTILFARVDLKARVTAASGSGDYFSGGHAIILPAADFPIKVEDEFDYDPSSGAFGRDDSLSIHGASVASLSLEQKSEWTPASDALDVGMLLQSWDGQLTLGPSIATIGLSADNRSRPPGAVAPDSSGESYGAAWLGAFQYALPAFESDSELRDVKATFSAKNASAKEFLSASLAESAQPTVVDGGQRNDSASMRIALPLETSGLSLEPFYSRSWTDTWTALSGGIVGDAQGALGDFADMPVLYKSLPFVELFSPATAAEFASQTATTGDRLSAANFLPEAGLNLSREYGSSWYDFIAPSTLALSYGRSLTRAFDQITDASVWSATAKIASINMFGSMGAYPLGLPFESDEYLSTFQAQIQEPNGGGAPSVNLQFHGLATLHARESDQLDAESKVSLTQAPGAMDWSCSLMLSLSRIVQRHWLLDLYSLATAPAVAGKDKVANASVASLYLQDLVAREPRLRSTISITAGLSGHQSDATTYLPGWTFAESYEAKLTVPERLTLKIDGSLGQTLTASTQVLDLGIQIGINAVISF
jgi:hypothetical protein